MGDRTRTTQIRTYLSVVPEDKKEEFSRAWGDYKKDTYAAAKRHGVVIEQGDSFNQVATLGLRAGHYALSSKMVSTPDIREPKHGDVGELVTGAIEEAVAWARKNQCTPLAASNVCDWDSAYAKDIHANVFLRTAIIDACKKHDIVLTGGETANLGDQVNHTGMSWLFVLLSRYEGDPASPPADPHPNAAFLDTLSCTADRTRFSMHACGALSLLHFKEPARVILTADGTGSKSIVCDAVGKRTDISDTLAMTSDDAARDRAFPLTAVIGVHQSAGTERADIAAHAQEAAKKHLLPIADFCAHASPHVKHYIMNGVVLSEVRAQETPAKPEPGLALVALYEQQRSNGITLQRRVFEDAFGKEWMHVSAQKAYAQLCAELGTQYPGLPRELDTQETLGELLATPSTPYFRPYSLMPAELRKSIGLMINVSSGGVFGKTRRLLEPMKLGAQYTDLFEAPELVILLQMASKSSRATEGHIPDEVAYYTWGCGTGAIIGTTEPEKIAAYFTKKGIGARVAGKVTAHKEVTIVSRCLESKKSEKPLELVHKYSDKPLG